MTPTRSSQPTPPARPATQQDVAQEAGVSRGLVSLALKGEGRMADRTRQRILDAAERLRYSPNTAAAELASRRSRRLAVVVPYLDNPFFDVLLRSLRAEAKAAGFILAAFVSDLVDQIERATIEDVLSLRPEGLILPGTALSMAELSELERQVPLVVMDRDLPSLPRQCGHLTLVRMDEEAAASQLTEHLAAQGVTRLLFLAPDRRLHEPLVEERRSACRRAARRLGVRFTSASCDGGATPALRRAVPAWSRSTDAASRGQADASGRALGSERVGVIVYNDVLALDVHAALLGLGLRPGAQVALASYDNSSLAARPELMLTSVDQSPRLLAQAAIQALLDPRERGAQVRTVAPSLVVRASSRLA